MITVPDLLIPPPRPLPPVGDVKPMVRRARKWVLFFSSGWSRCPLPPPAPPCEDSTKPHGAPRVAAEDQRPSTAGDAPPRNAPRMAHELLFSPGGRGCVPAAGGRGGWFERTGPYLMMIEEIVGFLRNVPPFQALRRRAEHRGAGRGGGVFPQGRDHPAPGRASEHPAHGHQEGRGQGLRRLPASRKSSSTTGPRATSSASSPS